MNIHFLGDIHGDFQFYFKWLSKKDPNDISIVLGDFGLGFHHLYDKEYQFGIKKYSNAWFLRGNHDNPEVCNKQEYCLGDYGLFLNKIFYIAGAWSIDRDMRTPYKDWWPNEELSYTQLEDCIKLYEKSKPNIVISHECPSSIRDMVVPPIGIPHTRTGLAMTEMLNIHKPSWFIFAHYHVSKTIDFEGTRFICLNVKQDFTLPLN